MREEEFLFERVEYMAFVPGIFVGEVLGEGAETVLGWD